jgi:hypothetical protein
MEDEADSLLYSNIDYSEQGQGISPIMDVLVYT